MKTLVSLYNGITKIREYVQYEYFVMNGILVKNLAPGNYEIRVKPKWLRNRVKDFTLKVTANHDVNLVTKEMALRYNQIDTP